MVQKRPLWWNPVKLYKKKALNQVREKETWDMHQSPGKHTAQKRRATRR
jgi:hypothetical protein